MLAAATPVHILYSVMGLLDDDSGIWDEGRVKAFFIPESRRILPRVTIFRYSGMGAAFVIHGLG